MANERVERKEALVAVHTVQTYDAEAKKMVEHKPGTRFEIGRKEADALRKVGAAVSADEVDAASSEASASDSPDPTV